MSTKQEIQRLKALGHKKNTIAKKLGLEWRTVNQYWQSSEDNKAEYIPAWADEIDWDDILRRFNKGHFATSLYEELQAKVKDIGSYDSFNRYLKKINVKSEDEVIIRIQRKPGYELEVDYSGDSIALLSPSTGEVIKTELFVGCLPFSDYIFAEFTFTQKTDDFISSHCNMFEHLGGVPLFLIPDNAKVAVNNYDYYDPGLNKTYHDMANHYGVGIAPARPYRPKDKPSVERAVGLIQQHFFRKVEGITFTSLGDLNRALKDWLEEFNNKKMKRSSVSRAELFEEEKKYLRDIPDERYQLFYWKSAKVHPDCHFQFDYNYYSVPYKFVGKEIYLKYNHQVVMAYYQNEKICMHTILKGHGHYQTNLAHYPEKKLVQDNYSLAQALKEAALIGENMGLVVKKLIDRGAHPLANLRKIQGILRLKSKYSVAALEYGCERALISEKLFYQYINNCSKHYSPERFTNNDEAPKREPHLICLHGGYEK